MMITFHSDLKLWFLGFKNHLADKLSRCKFNGQTKKCLKMKLTKIAIERGQCNLGSGPIHFEMFQ